MKNKEYKIWGAVAFIIIAVIIMLIRSRSISALDENIPRPPELPSDYTAEVNLPNLVSVDGACGVKHATIPDRLTCDESKLKSVFNELAKNPQYKKFEAEANGLKINFEYPSSFTKVSKLESSSSSIVFYTEAILPDYYLTTETWFYNGISIENCTTICTSARNYLEDKFKDVDEGDIWIATGTENFTGHNWLKYSIGDASGLYSSAWVTIFNNSIIEFRSTTNTNNKSDPYFGPNEAMKRVRETLVIERPPLRPLPLITSNTNSAV